MIAEIAQKIMKGIITENNFSNLTNPIVQQLIKKYRQLQKISQESSAFGVIFIDLAFAKWIKTLTKTQAEKYLKSKVDTVSIRTLLNVCSNINKNCEILKFIVFAILNYPYNLAEIAQMSGKSTSFIHDCALILNACGYPITNRLLLEDDKKRFLLDLDEITPPERSSKHPSSDLINKSILDYINMNIISHFKNAREVCEKFHEKLVEIHNLVIPIQKLLKSMLFKSIPFFVKNYTSNLTSSEAMYVYSELLVKKELYMLNKNNPDYILLRPWLILHEIFSKENTERFQDRKGVYKTHCNEILNDLSFCQEQEKIDILYTPDYSLRLTFLIRYLGVKKKYSKTITEFIHKCVNMGYLVNSTNIKEILASSYYLYLQMCNVDVKLNAVSRKFEISEKTLIKRTEELEVYAS